jgi:hypothetical protein
MDYVATADLVNNFDQTVRRAINEDMKLAAPESAALIHTALLQFAGTSAVVGRRQECDAMVELFCEEGTLALVSGGMSTGIDKDFNAVDSALGEETGSRSHDQRPVKIVYFDASV